MSIDERLKNIEAQLGLNQEKSCDCDDEDCECSDEKSEDKAGEDLTNRVSKLESELKSFKEEVLGEEKKATGLMSYYTWPTSLWWGDSPKTISLKEKIEALAKHLKINFINKQAQSEVVAVATKAERKPRSKKSKKK